MSYKPPRRPQFFYTTAPLPCPYLAGRTERKVVTEITGPDADALHDRLSRAGFRRSHNIAYAPVCPSCQACVPIRIPVGDLPARPHAAQDRARQCAAGGLRGAGARHRRAVPVVPALPAGAPRRRRHGDDEFLRLSRHGGGHADRDLHRRVPRSRRSAWSARAWPTGWATGCRRSTRSSRRGWSSARSARYAILWLIERARSLGLPYVYLGYWVPESRKMAYKSRFRPAEVLAGGAWRMLTEADAGRWRRGGEARRWCRSRRTD